MFRQYTCLSSGEKFNPLTKYTVNKTTITVFSNTSLYSSLCLLILPFRSQKLTIPHSRNSPAFYGGKSFLTAFTRYPIPSHINPFHTLRLILTIHSHLYLDIPSDPISPRSPLPILYAHFLFPSCYLPCRFLLSLHHRTVFLEDQFRAVVNRTV